MFKKRGGVSLYILVIHLYSEKLYFKVVVIVCIGFYFWILKILIKLIEESIKASGWL